MVTLLKLHPVACGDVALALSYALEYRGRLPEVWIVRNGRSDYLEVMQPVPCGGRPAPGRVEVASFENAGHSPGLPYFKVVFGPGVMHLVEARSWVEKVEA